MLRNVFIYLFCFGIKAAICEIMPEMPFNDTITLATSQKSIELKNGKQQIVVPLKIAVPFDLQQPNCSLLFESLQVNPLPEGVYEVYLSADCPPKGHLSSEDKRFIGLLDLYSLSDGTKKTTSLAMTDAVQPILNGKKKGGNYYLIVQFSGNVLPHGKPVPHTGHLLCSRIRFVQH